VTTDPSSALAQARRDLGVRLRQLRKGAGLTGQAVAESIGQHVTKVSRIENGAQPPSERNIQDWCVACGATEQIPQLLATHRTTESAYLEWTRASRAGMRRMGDLATVESYRRTTTFRVHEPLVMPGIFQTETYMRQMLAFWYPFLDAPDDTDANVALKQQRTAAALLPSKRIAVVLGEQALHTRRGTPSDHAEQLRHLLSLLRLPFLSVGVIPADAQRHAVATVGFWIFDNSAVALETPTAAIKVTRPQEIALYARMFDMLQKEAVYGTDARGLISATLTSL